MIGMGIERAKELADRSNEDLMSTLEETSACPGRRCGR